MPFPPGHILNNRYRIDSLLSQTLQTCTYAGWDQNLNMAVAIKTLHLASPDEARRFTRQARSISNLRHPSLPYVIDHFAAQDEQVLVSEFIQGQSLHAYLTLHPGPIAERQALPWFIQACDALAYLHTQQPLVLHRNLKPATFLITSVGQAALVDYGMGRTTDRSAATVVSGDPLPGETPDPYAAPEGPDSDDPRSDLYSLGAMLYLALTGAPPTLARLRQRGQPLPAPRRLNPAISPACETALLCALELEPQQRHASARAMHAALSAALSAAPGAAQPAAAPQTLLVQPSPHPVAAPALSPHPSPVPATLRAPEPPYPAPALAPTQAAPYANGYAAPAYSPQPATVIAPPAPARRASAFSTSLVILLVAGLCLALAALAGLGGYWMMSFPTPTPTTAVDIGAAIAATLTHEAALLPPASATFTQQPSFTPVSPTTAVPILPPPITASLTPTFTLPPSASPTPTNVPSPTPVPTWQPCPATYPSRLYVGDTVMVSTNPPLANRVRQAPNTGSVILGMIQPGEQAKVIGGPVCSNQWIWWQVTSLSTGLTGWTAEGDISSYWLIPMR